MDFFKVISGLSVLLLLVYVSLAAFGGLAAAGYVFARYLGS